jgi:cadmium resistance protein CadD (predicted permease)
MGLRRLRDVATETRLPTASTITGIATTTFANGADNISVFTPLFRSLHPTGITATVTVFLAMVAIWCAAGAWLGGHRLVVTALGRIGHWLVPVVFIGVGVFILVTTEPLAAVQSTT